MRQNLRNSGSEVNRLIGRLAAEKKKTVIAACLILIMVFMWIRVFTKKGPQSANATVMATKATGSQENPELKMFFIELPKVNGRNDVLTKDFFAVGSWRIFMEGGERSSGGVEGISVFSRNGSEETIRRVAGKLRLEAIVQGKNPQVFINDELLSVGDKLFVKDGIDTYGCEVAEIEENMVLIRCGEAEVTLRLTQTSRIDY